MNSDELFLNQDNNEHVGKKDNEENYDAYDLVDFIT